MLEILDMEKVVQPDWLIIEEYQDGDYDVLVEGLYESANHLSAYAYQVSYRPTWTLLIGNTNSEPASSDVHDALGLTANPPELRYANAKSKVLGKLFLRLESMSKQKGHCIVCGRTGAGVSPKHDTTCVLSKALSIVNR